MESKRNRKAMEDKQDYNAEFATENNVTDANEVQRAVERANREFGNEFSQELDSNVKDKVRAESESVEPGERHVNLEELQRHYKENQGQ